MSFLTLLDHKMQFYYSRQCPHSLSMLEILTKFQTNYQPTDIEMIDVHASRAPLPPEIVGTPAIFADGRYFHGDDAFERISSSEIDSRARPSINSSNARQAALDPANFANPEQPQTPQPPPPAQSSTTSGVDAMTSMFDDECIMPRKG